MTADWQVALALLECLREVSAVFQGVDEGLTGFLALPGHFVCLTKVEPGGRLVLVAP